MFTLGKNDVHIKCTENLKQCHDLHLLWHSGYGVGLVISGSAVQIPEGEVNFFIIITVDTTLLIISRSPHGPKRV